jgi:hypothetical protein
MKTFEIEGDLTTPNVLIDESKRMIEISGNSTLREPHWFYCNLLKWMLAFNLGSLQTETINIRLVRINESSSRWLILILKKLSAVIPGSKIQVNWYLAGQRKLFPAAERLIREIPGFQVNLVSQN